GHMADGVFWFDDNTGRWVSSRYYRKDGTLPEWANAINAEKIPESYFGKSWTLSVPESAMRRLWSPPGHSMSEYVDDSTFGASFPHPLSAGQSTPSKKFYGAFAMTPYANAWVLESAARCV